MPKSCRSCSSFVMSRWPSTSESLPLLSSLRRQPLLIVLRAEQPLQLLERVAQLNELGLRHVEIAASAHPDWSEQCRELRLRFPAVRFGAASVLSSEALACAAEAGLGYAFSPVLDPSLVEQARDLGILLVPGVMTPTEVHRAIEIGCGMVKLYPAMTLGPTYWRSLSGPLGPMPFCIAAGGLRLDDVPQWLRHGVDAVALGQGVADEVFKAPTPDLRLHDLLDRLNRAFNPRQGETIGSGSDR
ncbi:MAG: bifunctional 4-hydroxy-2-oxoglutarate aldolase/2-dehydro-3-deoxy-phosphogluconate aldolase [Synechococcaceae cyanobacterium ELA445]